MSARRRPRWDVEYGPEQIEVKTEHLLITRVRHLHTGRVLLDAEIDVEVIVGPGATLLPHPLSVNQHVTLDVTKTVRAQVAQEKGRT